MKIDFKKLIIGVLALSVLLVAFSLVYYYVYFLPQKESMQLKYEEEKETKQLELEIKKIELEEQKQKQLEKQLEKERLEKETIRLENKRLLAECLKAASDSYRKFWDKECEGLGKKKGCRLPSGLGERVDKSYKENKDLCLRIFPQD